MDSTPKQSFINSLVDNEKVLANMIEEGVADEEITATKGFDQAQIDTMKSRLAEFDVAPAEEETSDSAENADTTNSDENSSKLADEEKKEEGETATAEGEQSSEVAADDSVAGPAAESTGTSESDDSQTVEKADDSAPAAETAA